MSTVLCTGIGRATVKALVQCGAEVIALSRTEADLESLKQEVRGHTNYTHSFTSAAFLIYMWVGGMWYYPAPLMIIMSRG